MERRMQSGPGGFAAKIEQQMKGQVKGPNTADDVDEKAALHPDVPATKSGDYPSNDSPDSSQDAILTKAKCAKDKCNILVVVDMQKDYCKGCGSTTESQWASTGVKALADPIKQLLAKSAKFDLIIFTQDWLASGKPFLVHDTNGAKVMDELEPPAEAKSKTFYFTKGADDWLNHGYWGGRQFAIKGETGVGAKKPTPLDDILVSAGYTPDKTSMYVTGTATYRCVMKGSVHANALGFDVNIVADSVEGDGDKGDWDRYGVPGTPPADKTLQQWKMDVFSTRGGPDVAKRQSILKNAGVKSCANAAAVIASIDGKACPVTKA